MRFALAAATLVRHRARTLLAVLGVAVSAALLLDMVMLAGGMRESFRDLLLVHGYQLRLTPKGTLPFDAEATIDAGAATAAAVRATPGVGRVSPVLGGQLHVLGGGRGAAPNGTAVGAGAGTGTGTAARDGRAADGATPVATAFALGLDPRVQGDYELATGRDARTEGELVVNDAFLRAAGARVGDTLDVSARYDPQLRQWGARQRLVLVGTARFHYMPVEQPVAALALGTLQALRGDEGRDRLSLLMAEVAPGADEEQVRATLERTIPRLSAISTATALAQVEQRLSYFRQLALILGAIALVIGFLLVSTLVTVSVNERVGEIAVLRAIGVSRRHVVEQIVLEGLALSAAGALLGLALGLVTARYLNAILSDFPGLPAGFAFFVFRGADAWTSLGLLVVAGVLAGVYPSWRAASLPVAATLREEAVG